MPPSESLPRVWYVYALREPDTGEVRYVGKTLDTVSRLKLHCSNTSGCSAAVRQWICSLGQPPSLAVLAVFDSEQQALIRERKLIEQFHGPRLLNVQNVPGPPRQSAGFSGFGSRVRSERKRLRFSQVAFARSIGMNQGQLSRIESGQTSDVSASNAVRIARALGVSVEYLVSGEDAPGRLAS